MKLVFTTLGKTKNAECRALTEYWLGLCGKFADIERVELASAEKVAAWLAKRSTRKHLTVLDERGKAFESRKFAAELGRARDSGVTEWILLCGTEHGFSESLKKQATLVWSLSPLTFPHELAAAIASEQLFRAFTILSGHPYHND